MRQRYTLTSDNPRQTVNLQFEAAELLIDNPTSSALLIRVGGNDYPSRPGADYIIPAASLRSIPVNAANFALALETPAGLTAGTPALGALSGTAYALFLDASERTPTASAVVYESLSTADPLGTVQTLSAPGTVGPFDLNAWGGLLVELQASGAAGQMRVRYQTSADQVTWVDADTYPLWPFTTLQMALPRRLRYGRLTIDTPTGLTGTIGVSVMARLTLQEILAVSGHATSAAAGGLVVNAGATLDTWFFTAYLPAVEFWAAFTIGASPFTFQIDGSDAVNGTTVTDSVDTYPGVIGPPGWRRLITRPQLYTRVRVTNGGGSQAQLNLFYRPLFDADLPPVFGQRLPVRAADGDLVTLGTTSDAADASTVYGKVKQLRDTTGAAADVVDAPTIYGQVKQLRATAGTPADLTDAANLYGKLLAVRAILGTSTDASDTANLYGKLLAVRIVLGTGTDAADAATLFGQVKQIRTITGASGDVVDAPTLYGQTKQLRATLGTAASDAVDFASLYGKLLAVRAVLGTPTDPNDTATIYGKTLALRTILGAVADAVDAATIYGQLKQLRATAGTPADASDTATLYGKLLALRTVAGTGTDAADSASIYGKIRQLRDIVGASGDAVDAATVYGQLKQLRATAGTPADASDTATLYGKLLAARTVLGTGTDAADSTSVYGKLAAVRATLGLTSDAADAASLYGKLRQVRDMIGSSGDAANAATVFGQLKQIQTNTNLPNGANLLAIVNVSSTAAGVSSGLNLGGRKLLGFEFHAVSGVTVVQAQWGTSTLMNGAAFYRGGQTGPWVDLSPFGLTVPTNGYVWIATDINSFVDGTICYQ